MSSTSSDVSSSDVQLSVKILKIAAPVIEYQKTSSSSSTGAFSFQLLPTEVKAMIFSRLDIYTFCKANVVCKDWYELMNHPSIWKELCERDFLSYLQTTPFVEGDTLEIENHDDEKQKNLSNNNSNSDSEEDEDEDTDDEDTYNAMHPDTDDNDDIEISESGAVIETDGYDKPAPNNLDDDSDSQSDSEHEQRLSKKEPNSSKVEKDSENWKSFYKACYFTTDLSGLWTAEYGVHGEEIVQVKHTGYELNATKITGDVNVPAGKPTFKMRLSENTTKGQGQLHLADTGYQNPRWGRASILIKDHDHFEVYWYFSFPVTMSLSRRWHTLTLKYSRMEQSKQQAFWEQQQQTATVTTIPANENQRAT